MNYKAYSIEDFLADEDFQRWVLENSNDEFWRAWIEGNPANLDQALEAKKLIQLMKFKEVNKPHMDTNASWKSVIKKIDSAKNVHLIPESEGNIFVTHRLMIYKIAASFVGIVIVASILLLNRTVEHTTAYGETKQVILPDSSVVILNGNSSLSYDPNTFEEEVREVVLEGEAYFTVVHTVNDHKFIVKTDKGLMVQVLGTEFDISNRESGTKVVLTKGKVQLKMNHIKDSVINMKPGELVQFNNTNEGYTKKSVQTEFYTSWTKQKLIFENTSIEEIAQILSDSYGVKVEVEDKSLLSKRVSGTAPINNIDMFIEALSGSFNLNIEKDKNRIIIKNN